jgi:hypothetical protein
MKIALGRDVFVVPYFRQVSIGMLNGLADLHGTRVVNMVCRKVGLFLKLFDLACMLDAIYMS